MRCGARRLPRLQRGERGWRRLTSRVSARRRFRRLTTPRARSSRPRPLALPAMEVPNLPGYRSNRHTASTRAQSLHVATDVHGRTASYTASARSRPYRPPSHAATKGTAYSPSRRDADYHATFRQRELRESGRVQLPFADHRRLPDFLRHDRTGNHGQVRRACSSAPAGSPPAWSGGRKAVIRRRGAQGLDPPHLHASGPAHSLRPAQVLKAYAYFKEAVPESSDEDFRIRRCACGAAGRGGRPRDTQSPPGPPPAGSTSCTT